MIMVAICSFAATAALMPVVLLILRRLQVLDVPSDRSSHEVVTPRGGGLGVFLGAVLGLVVGDPVGSTSLTTLLVCTGVFAVMGLIDDIRGLPVKVRLLGQLGFAAAFVGPWFLRNAPATGSFRLLLAAFAVVWVIGYLNAFNFMDGVNGISGLHAMVAGVTFATIGAIADQDLLQVAGIAVAAAALGFLPYNFPRARLFLGDVGSYFLGTWIAILALIALISQIRVEAVFGALAIYLADTAYTLVSRVLRGADWRQSHHEHVYQQLVDAGWSHGRTAFFVAGCSSMCAGLGLISQTGNLPARIVADVALLVIVVGYLRLPRRLGVTPLLGRGHVGTPLLPAGPETDA